jgi:tRNA (guanine9-N1)-methyltransferase
VYLNIYLKKELLSLTNQLGYSYGKNKKAPKSMKMCITSFDDALKKNLDEKLESWHDWKEQHIQVTTKHYMDEFEKDKLVYLSADSDNTIQTLDDGMSYIVGGIVDKNRYKGLCQGKATQHDIQTARLPIGEYLELSTRKVLTVNQGKM